MKLVNRLVTALAVAGTLLASSAAMAQAYPNKPIKLVVPWAAGGPSDFVARVVTEGMRKDLGQPILIENKVGATGRIGTDAVRTAAPDGYTLLLAISNTHGVAPALYPNLPYDPVKDFSSVGVMAIGPLALTVRSSLPIKTLPELVAYAKRNPGKLTFASAGNGSGSHLLGEMLKAMGGIDILHVPYKGSAPAINDLAAGSVDIMFEGLALKPYVESGRLRVIATTGARRWSAYPEAPTTTEGGLPKLQSATWFGIMGPKGMPQPVVDRLSRALVAALKSTEIQAQLKTQGMEVATATSPAEMNAFVSSEVDRWKGLIKSINYKHESE